MALPICNKPRVRAVLLVVTRLLTLSSRPPSSILDRCSLFLWSVVTACCQARKAFTLSPSTSCTHTISASKSSIRRFVIT